MKEVIVVGAGLAGCEAAYQLAKRGVKVKLYEMRPSVATEAHTTDYFAELVCSNSLGSNLLSNASGLMKEELRLMDSLVIRVADEFKVPAGQALAVDRTLFASKITDTINNMQNIEVINEEYTGITSDIDTPIIIASGPLTSNALSKDIEKLTSSDNLYFYDAAAPILTLESIDMDKVYYQSRYDKGDGEYINCPMTREQYENFYTELMAAQTIPLKNFEKEKFFEGCMPVEKLASRGEKTLLFGPLKPKGLTNPRLPEGVKDHAVVQLRQDNKEGTLYNIVGFQTNLKWGEQKRVFSMIPGLENADFVRLGVMHRNTFINSTTLLNPTLNLKSNPNIYFAGQITGCEGYVASIATGLMAAVNLYSDINNGPDYILDSITSTGAIIKYITEEKKNFQPMGPNFGIIDKMEGKKIRDKRERYTLLANRSMEYMEDKVKEIIQ